MLVPHQAENRQKSSSVATVAQNTTHALVGHTVAPLASTYCTVMKLSALSKQFLTYTVALPVVAAAAPLLHTQAAPGAFVDGQASLPFAGVPEHVQDVGLCGSSFGLRSSQLPACAPVQAKQACRCARVLQSGRYRVLVQCPVSHATSHRRHGRRQPAGWCHGVERTWKRRSQQYQ